jgi:hypothetical protein
MIKYFGETNLKARSKLEYSTVQRSDKNPYVQRVILTDIVGVQAPAAPKSRTGRITFRLECFCRFSSLVLYIAGDVYSDNGVVDASIDEEQRQSRNLSMCSLVVLEPLYSDSSKRHAAETSSPPSCFSFSFLK